LASGKTILIVEDEADLAETIQYNLEREGYSCRVAYDGGSALGELRRQTPDLVLLDRMLPDTSGDEVLIELKRDPRSASVPVVVLTAKTEEADQLIGFALGAADYITKPFSMKLLVARVSAVLRRAADPRTEPAVLESGPIALDVARHEVCVNNKPASLTTTEFKLLRTLLAANGRVLTRDQLINAVMGAHVAITDRAIDVHVTAIRKKLGEAADWIQTVRGVGYAVRQPV
jgi:two-component system phosphate regulon response regulator PhoB